MKNGQKSNFREMPSPGEALWILTQTDTEQRRASQTENNKTVLRNLSSYLFVEEINRNVKLLMVGKCWFARVCRKFLKCPCWLVDQLMDCHWIGSELWMSIKYAWFLFYMDMQTYIVTCIWHGACKLLYFSNHLIS